MPKTQKNWIYDLLAAVSVSLVALPISLALAKASGLDSIAGVISTVIGGIAIFLFGGSNVTITGPGNGLVLVIATSILSIGLGATFAAIICSGAILYLCGWLRLGGLSDFFPSSSIQGLLAAIGVTLMLKQLHLMLGVQIDFSGVSNTLEIFAYLPKIFSQYISTFESNYSGHLGLASLILLVGYTFIKHPVVKFLPAPMWSVLIGIGFYYYFDFKELMYPISDDQLLHIQAGSLFQLNMPDFDDALSFDFISACLSITLICLIESLLSIKAVDKIDPFQRRSNFNKDLKALGIGTAVSGLLGGMPVVTVIARSSVNVNQGGQTRKSGLFASIMILLLVIFLSQELNKIPVSILASILVFTGYKLAEPSKWKKVWQVGPEQFLIFVATLVGTLMTNLVIGIVIGMLITTLIQISIVRQIRKYISAIIRPNVIAIREDADKHLIGVKGYATFLNYLRLKKSLDRIPNKEHIVVDFSLTRFVDHSVMDHMETYAKDYENKGGVFEVIGLDVHRAGSGHPLAIRGQKSDLVIVPSKLQMTPRQKQLDTFANTMNWKFFPHKTENLPNVSKIKYFSNKTIHFAFNVIEWELNDVVYECFDIEYHEGDLILQEKYRSTMMFLTFNTCFIPAFEMNKDSLVKRVIQLKGANHITFDTDNEFSKNYFIEGNDAVSIKAFFTDELMKYLITNAGFLIESINNRILITRKGRLASLSEVKELILFAQGLTQIIQKNDK